MQYINAPINVKLLGRGGGGGWGAGHWVGILNF